MRRQPTSFLRARLLAVFLLSLAAVSGSILAWRPDRAGSPLGMAWPPLALGAAALAGAAIHEGLAALTDRHLRDRVRSVVGVAYGAALFVIGLALLAGHRAGAERGVGALQAFQPLFLLLAGFGRGYLGALINAFVLTAASMLAGGPGAAASATLHGGLMAFFLAADHASRKLTEYPVDAMPPSGPILARGAIQALLVSAALAGWFALVPPSPYTRLEPAAAAVSITPDRLAGLLGNLLLVAALSTVAFYLALRLGGGSGQASAEAPLVVRVPARRSSRPVEGAAAAEEPPASKPWSVRIVKLYVRTTEQLARWGRRRRPFQTPKEFSATLPPAGAAAELADLFGRARYGREDLTEAEYDRATRASREILDHHRRRS